MITRTQLTTSPHEQAALKAGVLASQVTAVRQPADRRRIDDIRAQRRNLWRRRERRLRLQGPERIGARLQGSQRWPPPGHRILPSRRCVRDRVRIGAFQLRRSDRQGDHPGRATQQRVQHRGKQQRGRAASLVDHGRGTQALPESRAAADQDRQRSGSRHFFWTWPSAWPERASWSSRCRVRTSPTISV